MALRCGGRRTSAALSAPSQSCFEVKHCSIGHQNCDAMEIRKKSDLQMFVTFFSGS